MVEQSDDDRAPVQVRYGAVLAGAVRFSFNDNINPVYRGQVQLSDGSTVLAFIKDIDLREMANEVFAALIASQLGLPVPLPIIARAEVADLPATKIPLPGTSSHVVFASAAVSALPILQLLNAGGPSPHDVLARLAKWAGLADLYAFDSWVANIDRHQGNLLFSGQDDVWLIDHGHCFTGRHWKPENLAPAHPYRNRLMEWLTPSLASVRRMELAGQAEAAIQAAAAVNLLTLASANGIHTMLGEDFSAIVAFLTARTEHIRKLSTTALGLLI